jgi:hypothetical protein
MVDTELQLLTTSRMRAFKTCRKLHWFQYEIGLRPIVDSHALRFGTAMHQAIETAESIGVEPALTAIADTAGQWPDPYTPDTLCALLTGYMQHYAEHPFRIEPIIHEQPFVIPLVNPETGSDSRTFSLAGKIDLLGTINGNGVTCLRETKTTGETPGDKYWRRLLMDPQVSLYFLAARQMGYDVQTIVYDVIRKPSMAPGLATPPEARKYKKDGTLYANQRATDETPVEWGARLIEDIASRPDFYYARREIPRLEQDLDLFKWEVWDIAKDLRQAQLSGRWYRNAGRWTCDNCAYFGPCSGLCQWEPESGIAPEGFQYVNNVNPELEETNVSITNSTADGATAVQ